LKAELENQTEKRIRLTKEIIENIGLLKMNTCETISAIAVGKARE
jgi:hypothetical protein